MTIIYGLSTTGSVSFIPFYYKSVKVQSSLPVEILYQMVFLARILLESDRKERLNLEFKIKEGT